MERKHLLNSSGTGALQNWAVVLCELRAAYVLSFSIQWNVLPWKSGRQKTVW